MVDGLSKALDKEIKDLKGLCESSVMYPSGSATSPACASRENIYWVPLVQLSHFHFIPQIGGYSIYQKNFKRIKTASATGAQRLIYPNVFETFCIICSFKELKLS